MRRWTAQTDAAADVLFPSLTTAEIRHRQDLARVQIRLAVESGFKNDTLALMVRDLKEWLKSPETA